MNSCRTCVRPDGKFTVGMHQPRVFVDNLRGSEYISQIGELHDNRPVDNSRNFPATDIQQKSGDTVYEILNPFPFRGATYINARWADRNVVRPEAISLEKKERFSLKAAVKKWFNREKIPFPRYETIYRHLPRPLLIAVSESSDDPEELKCIAKSACSFIFKGKNDAPCGVRFTTNEKGDAVPDIKDHLLYEIVANNRFLPDEYKKAMLLVPGIQGPSEITAEKKDTSGESHVFEYLRANSYIPWGHFAANMADSSVRYTAGDLSLTDVTGMRHLYYQRTYVRLARQLQVPNRYSGQPLSEDQLEVLREKILEALSGGRHEKLLFNAALWGWNFGFGCSHSGYRLHASHQQVHQQYAMIPSDVTANHSGAVPSFHCGDLVDTFIQHYRKETGKSFFKSYLSAIRSNRRTDGTLKGESSLVVFEDENVILFVPKAQMSQWELQLMPKKRCGNIVESDTGMRSALDRALLKAVQTLELMGARMVTVIEFSKRFDSQCDDFVMVYSFLPKLPYSPGAFSEAQSRYISGHYPEDFAAACRLKRNQP